MIGEIGVNERTIKSPAILFPLLLAAAAAGCAHGLRKPEVPAGPSLTVLTYNVNWGGYRADLSAQAIRDANADVVCLQETNPAWEAYLRANLGAVYPHMAFRHRDGAGGQAFLSRFALEDVAFMEPQEGWFPGWIVVADTPIGRVQFLNVHLHPPLSESGSVSAGAYFETRAVRLHEIRQFHGRLRPEIPTIVCGDFNESESGSAVEWLTQQGMTDALSEFDRTTRTWEWPTSVYTLRNRFDHILYAKPLYCCSARVIRAGASDHFPVLAVFGPAKLCSDTGNQGTP